MDLSLEGKVAVVTGGSSGIGLATARVLLAEGAAVAICGRDNARLQAAKAALAVSDVRLLASRCDVLKEADVKSFAQEVESWRGACDILINNAGQARISTFATTDDKAWRDELDLKFFSQIYPIRA